MGNNRMEFLVWLLIVLLVFSNWLWYVFYKSYTDTIQKHLDKHNCKEIVRKYRI